MDIRFSTSDVRDFLEAQPDKAKSKFIWFFEQLEIRGLPQLLQSGNVKKITANKGLFYLKYGSNKIAYRYFFTIIDDIYWILHGFSKKSQEIPQKELALAKKRYQSLLNIHKK